MFELFDESGLFVTVCHHQFVLLVCDMVKSGELLRISHPIWLITNIYTGQSTRSRWLIGLFPFTGQISAAHMTLVVNLTRWLGTVHCQLGSSMRIYALWWVHSTAMDITSNANSIGTLCTFPEQAQRKGKVVNTCSHSQTSLPGG